MTIHRLAEMTWEEVRALDLTRAVAILPIGAVEAHGPHLPLATDAIIAEAMARDAAGRLTSDALILPTFAYSVANYAAAFPGSLSMRGETVTAMIVDIAHALESHGIKKLVIANAHLDPSHLASLHAAVSAIRGMKVAFPDITKKPWATRLTEEFKSGACHAGQFECSIVMAERPDWVREAIRKALPANPVSIGKAIRDGKKTFEEAGGPRAYFGNPAAATTEEGRKTIETLGAILAEAIAAL